MTPLGRISGQDGVEASFQSVFAAARGQKTAAPYLDIKPRDLAIQMLAGGAVITFHFDRSPSEFGRRTLILEKQYGTWRIVHLHGSNLERAA